MHELVHGKPCVRLGGRLYAIRKEQTLTDRIHAATQIRGASGYDRAMTFPRKSRVLRA